jgi:t-SNARE complex subunit (syntaxin)
MSEDVRHFAEKLCSLLANDENIVSEKLNKYIQETDPRLIALINHELFSNEHRLTNYLKAALANPKATEAVRKKVINFISDYVESHYLYLVEHVKKLFEELISNFWKE